MSEPPEEKDAPAQTPAAAEPVPCADLPLPARVEALLLSTDRPLTEARLSELVGGGGGTAPVRAAIEQLNTEYEQTGRAFRAQRVAGGWQLLTLPPLGPLVNRLHRDRRESRLSQAALETLAIIAYRQPIMRAEIEAIRGVACGEVLRALLQRRLIRITGRAEQLGRPMLYGTTGHFLRVFGLPGLDALPQLEGQPAAQAPARTEAGEGESTQPVDADNSPEQDPVARG
jgi:segregation and condensation protein B